MTVETTFFMIESGLAVMTSSAVTAIFKFQMIYLGVVEFHVELKLRMANFAGVPQAMRPVRERHGQYSLLL
jgi:hypothetical protein